MQSVLDVQQEYRGTPLAGMVVMAMAAPLAGWSGCRTPCGHPGGHHWPGRPERYAIIQIAPVEAPNFAFCIAPSISRSRHKLGLQREVIPLVLKQEGASVDQQPGTRCRPQVCGGQRLP